MTVATRQSRKNAHQTLPILSMRWGVLPALLISALSVVVPDDARAQNRNGAAATRPQEKMLKTRDQWDIPITYFPSSAGQETPVVVLLHMRQSNRLVWDRGFAERLQGEGYAVVTVDLRKHGQSKHALGEEAGAGSRLKPRDYQLMIVEDLEAVKKFLSEEHRQKRLNVRKTAIVAAEMSVPIALNFAVRDWLKLPYPDGPTLETRTPRGQDIRAMVLISPEPTTPGITTTTKAVMQLRTVEWEIAFLTIYGLDDVKDKGAAKKIYQKLSGPNRNKNRMYLKEYQVPLRGTDLLDPKLDTEAQMLAFLKRHLKSLPGKWKSRENRLRS